MDFNEEKKYDLRLEKEEELRLEDKKEIETFHINPSDYKPSGTRGDSKGILHEYFIN